MRKVKDALSGFGITCGDGILIALLLTAAALTGWIIRFFSPAPREVSVKADGAEICRLPLDQDTVYPIGDGNTIEIRDGRVRMIYADCPDQICVRTGAISHSGQSIVCAPHHIVVTITGGDDGADLYTH